MNKTIYLPEAKRPAPGSYVARVAKTTEGKISHVDDIGNSALCYWVDYGLCGCVGDKVLVTITQCRQLVVNQVLAGQHDLVLCADNILLNAQCNIKLVGENIFLN